MAVEAALKIVFDQHEFNLQFKSFSTAHKAYTKTVAAWGSTSAGAGGLLALEDDFSRQVTIDPSHITCVNIADFSVALEGDYAMASEQQKISLRLQREANNPGGVAMPAGPRLLS